MSFNRAECTSATSGYWRWVGDVEEMKKVRAAHKPSFRMTGAERDVACLDHDWLLAQTRAMNETASPRAATTTPRDTLPEGYSLCADIIDAQDCAKRDARVAKLRRREARAREAAADRSRTALANVRRAAHDAPFLPTTNVKGSRPFVEQNAYSGGIDGVDAYNDTKRGFLHSQDANHHSTVGPLLDHENKHVDTLNYLVVNHPPLAAERATVPADC